MNARGIWPDKDIESSLKVGDDPVKMAFTLVIDSLLVLVSVEHRVVYSIYADSLSI
jgi:hypothetical protein